MALAFDSNREHRLLVLPALFDEANKMRRQTVEVMLRLELSGVDTFLPDFTGCNESLQPMAEQTLANWRAGAEAAAVHFNATHVFSIRAGCLLAPPHQPGWRYAATTGAKALRSLLIPTGCEFDSRGGFPRGEKSESIALGLGGRNHGLSDRLAGRF